MIRCNFWQSFKKTLYMGFRATLNFRKFKVALNSMYRIFLNFAKSCILSCLSKFTPVEGDSCLDCESLIPRLSCFRRNRSGRVSFIISLCDAERHTMSWTNCQVKMRLVDIKHPCKMKLEYQNYPLYHDLLYVPNFARLEKFNYLDAFQLPTLSPRSPFPLRSAFFLFF